jgi:arylsulfatase A-like enzyme
MTQNSAHSGIVLMAVLCGLAAQSFSAARQPNIVLMLVDDMGHGDIAAHGNPILTTPNFDRLHNESLRFNDFMVSPTCAPTRAALMSGMHEFKVAVTHTVYPRHQMDLTATILPQTLKKAGYKTGMFGKWHLGFEGDYMPHKRGFDIALNDLNDDQRQHYDPVLLRNGVQERHKGYRTDVIFDEAMKYIEENKDGPFFCYLATYTPHSPLKVPEQYVEPYLGKSAKPEFHGMVAKVDENVGRLLAQLKKLHIDNDTLLIAMNDNGGTYGVDTWNSGMRGAKVNAYYGAVRAYSFWRWPGTIQPGERNQLTAHHDVLPTLASLAGVELDSEHREQLDGFDLSPLFQQDDQQWAGKDRIVVHHSGRWPSGGAQSHKHAFCGIRYGSYHLLRQYPCLDPECGKNERAIICKLHYEYINDPSRPGFYGAREHYKYTEPGKWSLFDLSNDPHEDHNLAELKPDVVAQMSESFDDWWAGLTFTEDGNR